MSTPPLRIGYKASAEQFGPQRLSDLAVLAEHVGLDSVTVSDHAQPWRVTGGHAPAALPWLGHVAARTDRVLLGTSVLTPSFRYNPAVLAQQVATLGCLAPGRLILGVGTGEALNEIAVGSVETWPDFRERFARLREAVRLIRALWTQDSVDQEGDYYRVRDLSIYDRPEEPVPVYVAAGGGTVARYAGRMGDGLICTSGKGRELYEDTLLPSMATGAAKGGRDVEALDRMIEIKISYDRDLERAREATRFWSPLALPAEQKHSIHSPVEMEQAADALPLEQIMSRWIVSDDPAEVVERVREYTDMGFTHLVLHAPGEDQERFLTELAEDVLPGLRELAPGRMPAAPEAEDG